MTRGLKGPKYHHIWLTTEKGDAAAAEKGTTLRGEQNCDSLCQSVAIYMDRTVMEGSIKEQTRITKGPCREEREHLRIGRGCQACWGTGRRRPCHKS